MKDIYINMSCLKSPCMIDELKLTFTDVAVNSPDFNQSGFVEMDRGLQVNEFKPW